MPRKASLIRELMRATKVSRRRKAESEHDHLKRIALAASELPNKVRANLSPEAQAWHQAAAESIGEGNAVANLTTQYGGPKDNQKSGDDAERAPGNETASSPQTHEEDSVRGPEVGKIPSASDRARRIILENLGRIEKRTLREVVANAGIAVTNSSFDTIYYETNKTMQIAKEMGLVRD